MPRLSQTATVDAADDPGADDDDSHYVFRQLSKGWLPLDERTVHKPIRLHFGRRPSRIAVGPAQECRRPQIIVTPENALSRVLGESCRDSCSPTEPEPVVALRVIVSLPIPLFEATSVSVSVKVHQWPKDLSAV
jgi:hypothetical protein